jgi:hypothetical protein
MINGLAHSLIPHCQAIYSYWLPCADYRYAHYLACLHPPVLQVGSDSLQNQLVISEPRRRTQIKRYGHDESMMDMSELDSSSDSDDELGRGTRGKNTLCEKLARHDSDSCCVQVARTRPSLVALDPKTGLAMTTCQKEKLLMAVGLDLNVSKLRRVYLLLGKFKSIQVFVSP